jgi:hypothetical protein
MGGGENQNDRPSDAPLTDEEFDAWWPLNYDDLDEYEREIEESLRDYEWVPPPHLEEERRRARVRVRRILADQRPKPVAQSGPDSAESPHQSNASAADDDA